MSDPRTPDMDNREALLIHIEGLQAVLTKRNARILQLETQLEAGGESVHVQRAVKRAYRDGWKGCAGHLMDVTRKAAGELGLVNRVAFEQYLVGDRLEDS